MKSDTFCGRRSLKSSVISASVFVVNGSPFVDSWFEEIEIEAGNTNCFSSIDSLIALNRTTLIGNFGLTEHVLVSREYDTLGSFSFTGCQLMLTVWFDDGS
jgi:hypothetical protein